jgi:pyruvate,water dikinase
LIQADAAGVAFTANPVTGVRDEALVSAVRGLGERLVSGQDDPDEWVVTANGMECRRAPEGAVDQAQVRTVADLARRIEAHFGQPAPAWLNLVLHFSTDFLRHQFRW